MPVRDVARFRVRWGAWRVTVRVVPSTAQMHVLWRERGGHAIRRGEYLVGLFFPSERAPLGTIALSAADLTTEIVAHEAVHAAVHAVRLLEGAPQTATPGDAEEYVAKLTGQLTRRVLRGLQAREIACA